MMKIDNYEIVSSLNNIQKEIFIWETRLSEKEKKVSDLSIQIQNLKIALNLFLGEYNSKVGVLYISLDKIKLRIKEYQSRINLAKGKKLSPDDLSNIEKEVRGNFFQERSKIDNLESETSDSSEEYDKNLEKEKEKYLDRKSLEKLKKLYRKLALRFHPDRAKNVKQRKEFEKIFPEINEAYQNGDLDTLKKYMKQAEREEQIAKEAPEEKLARLKKDYEIILVIILKTRKEFKDLKASETYKLKEKIDQAKEKGRDLLQELATNIKLEISENQKILDKLIAQYKEIIDEII
ncbi:MAG TPA: DnaJ domain-containing protein [Candidatus Paceibacterota bacterium]|nr:DnaJ domain-containing protein [Candidatus Paceibacterota bacterium]